MNNSTPILIFFTSIVIVLAILMALRAELTRGRGGKILAFVTLAVLPVLAVWAGVHEQLERSTSTKFCLSCHVMHDFGQSLSLDDKAYIPAVHYQNNFVPRDHACFTCHTTYTLFGDYRAKLVGLRHVYVNYLGTIPKKIALYQPYNNRECLHCHAGGRSFEEDDVHKGARDDLAAGKTSCLECHSTVHDVQNVAHLKVWHGGKP